MNHSPAHGWLALVETLGVAGAFVAAGALLDRNDPFLVRHGFSWLTFAPLLAGAWYGSFHGVFAGAVLGIGLAVAGRLGVPVAPAGLDTAIGWSAIGLVAGAFADARARRGVRLEAVHADLLVENQRLSRAHRALQASHDALRSRIPGEPDTLNDALVALADAMRAARSADPVSEFATRILHLLAEHAFVHSGSVHPVAAWGSVGEAVATMGSGASGPEDHLLAAAARTRDVTSVRDRSGGSDLLAAVPLVDVGGRVHAVVAVRDMPFVALHDETLNLLAAIGGHVGEAIGRARGGRGEESPGHAAPPWTVAPSPALVWPPRAHRRR